ncbi:hypothetical protein WME91_16490 [Sorangium sp. So ce269]
MRPHRRWPERRVDQVLAEERTRLLALPDPLPETDLVEPVPVDRTAFLHFDVNRYSAPSLHHGKTVMLVANDTTVRLLDGGTEVARHVRCFLDIDADSWRQKESLTMSEARPKPRTEAGEPPAPAAAKRR